MKALVLIDNLYTQYGLNGKEEDGILFLPMMKKELKNKGIRAIRKIHMSLLLPFKEIWLYKWQNVINQYETIILADAGNTYNVAKYIHTRWPDKRIIIWYRNSVKAAQIKPEKINRDICELWSFDKTDCKKYNMSYNPQFYMRNRKYQEKEKDFDAFFVGQDKGRMEILNEMKRALDNEGLKNQFCIVGVNSKRLSYNEVLDYISRSKVIIDCKCDWQEGITLRPLEAMFYQKKLITNCLDIASAPYYRNTNIFLRGKDDIRKLPEFIKTDYEKIPAEVINEYDITGWIRRFYS